MNLKTIFKPPIIREWTMQLKQEGLKGFLRKKGWKFLLAVCLYYLVRDTILYVVPFLIAQGLICR